ncbi:MAG: hemin uptake protein HemP [Hylemonella sp.]|nr:hemin uptake protein HemP [Hylemonella sp.]
MTTAMSTAPLPPAPAEPVAARDMTARLQPDVPLDSATLLQGGKAVTIRHNGEFYRLQATRQGKLILTK